MHGSVRQLSAGVVVVGYRHGRRRYLLLRAYGYWDFPKGLLEPGEEPIDAACREVLEETGIARLDFRWGYDYYETAPYGRGKIGRYYVAATPEEHVQLGVNPALGRPEHHEYRWASFPEGLDLLGDRVRLVLEWAHAKTRTGDQAPS